MSFSRVAIYHKEREMKLHVMAIYHIEKEMKENISILDAPDDVNMKKKVPVHLHWEYKYLQLVVHKSSYNSTILQRKD